jgi:TonB family protein
MIPRTLVPVDARLPADVEVSTRRRPTNMDERTLVPAMLPVVALDGHSNIPSNLPLESIAARVVVPRDIHREAYGVVENTSTPAQPSEMDERIAVPIGAAPPLVIEPAVGPAPDIVNPDVFLTGDVHFVAEPSKDRSTKWDVIVRVSSIAFHVLVIAAILLQAKFFPRHEPTPEEVEIARGQLTLLLPPGSFESPKPEVRTPPPPRVKVDPRELRRVAPTPPPPTPQPTLLPERPKELLPSAPIPKPNATPPPSAPEPKPDAPKAPLKLETPDMPQAQHPLVLPKATTNQSLQETIREAARNPNAGGRSGAVVGPMPKSSAAGGGYGGSQGAGGTLGNGYQILTPTEGVDFSDYMARVVASVRRNWYAVMPESAQLGDRGRVVLQFRIMRDGTVPTGEPSRLSGSGKDPLDRAAVSAIRSSNPFEPLPPAFSGPSIELRFFFLYNLPIEAAYQ